MAAAAGAVAAGAGAAGVGAMGADIILRLSDRAPELPEGADAKQVVIFRLELRQAADELGISAYIVGPIPAGAQAANINLARRWLLSGIVDKNLRGLLATTGGPDGPALYAWMQAHLLGGRNEQEVLHTIIDEFFYDGTTGVYSFFAYFVMVTNAIVPPLPPGRLCIMYSSRFPSEYSER